MVSEIKKVADVAPLSLAERDRRYALIRAALSERNVDALIVTGSQLFYLSGGLPGEIAGLLPTDENEAFAAVISWRYLVDIPKQVMLDAQDWVTELRSARSPAPGLIERLKELRLENGTIGYAGPLSFQAHSGIMKALPSVELVEVSDILNNARTLKSGEEIELIDRANQVFNAAITAIHETARPGMLGREVVQIGMNAMMDAGGDIDSAFSFNFGPDPTQNPVLAQYCLDSRSRTATWAP